MAISSASRWRSRASGIRSTSAEDHLAAVDTSVLKEVKIGSDTDLKKTDDDATQLSSGVHSRYNDSVGDMIRKSLGF